MIYWDVSVFAFQIENAASLDALQESIMRRSTVFVNLLRPLVKVFRHLLICFAPLFFKDVYTCILVSASAAVHLPPPGVHSWYCTMLGFENMSVYS